MKYSSHHRNHSYAFLLLLASVLCSSLVSFVDALGGEGKPAFIPPTAPPPAQERNWENEAASSASDMFTNEDYDAKDHDSYFEDLDDDSALTSSKRGNTEDFGFDIPSDFFSSDEEKTVKVSSAASRARKDRAVASRKYETSSSQSYSGAGGGGMSQVDSLSNEDGRNSLMGGKHVLYEAYNQLHTLAQVSKAQYSVVYKILSQSNFLYFFFSHAYIGIQ